MDQWIPIVASLGAAIVAGGFALRQSLLQWDRSSRREAEKELNVQRLKFYPQVQEFMSVIYGMYGGWLGAMQEQGRLQKMMELSWEMVLWASDDTLTTWKTLVDEGQRRVLDSTPGRLPRLWAELDANLRKDLGYGKNKALTPEDLYPILFDPETVDRLRREDSDR